MTLPQRESARERIFCKCDSHEQTCQILFFWNFTIVCNGAACVGTGYAILELCATPMKCHWKSTLFMYLQVCVCVCESVCASYRVHVSECVCVSE